MGFRFRKSINLGGGARLNLSKSGIGASAGGKGFRVTKKAGGGTRTTASIPGTGISYQKDSKSKRSKEIAAAANNEAMVNDLMLTAKAKKGWAIVGNIAGWFCILGGGVVGLIFPTFGMVCAGIGIGSLLGARALKKQYKKMTMEQ